METPPYLIQQYAAERRLSPMMAKRALYVGGLETTAMKVNDVASMIGVAPETLKGLARKLIIDFVDYRPYAKRRDKGEVMGESLRDIHAPVEGLPMFGKAA